MGMKVFEHSGMFDPEELGLSYDMEFNVICVGGGSSGYYYTEVSTNGSMYISTAGGYSGTIKYWSGKINAPVAVTVGAGGKAPANYSPPPRFIEGLPSSFGNNITANGGGSKTRSSIGGTLGRDILRSNSNSSSDQRGAGGAGGYVIGQELQFGDGGDGYREDQIDFRNRLGPTVNGGFGDGSMAGTYTIGNADAGVCNLTHPLAFGPKRSMVKGVAASGRGYGAGGGGCSNQYMKRDGDNYDCSPSPGNDGVVIVTW